MVRLLLRLVALLLALLVALPLHGTWRLFLLPSPWPRRFLAACAWIVGARARLVGAPPPANALILANHLSWIDILLLAGSADAVFVAKGELARVPLVGWLCRLNDTIFVERGDRMAIDAQVAAVREALGARPVAIFPEGTTGDGETLLPFKSSLLAAIDPPPTGLVVQPCRIDYGKATRDLAWIRDENGARHAARVLRRRGSFVATLAFAEPFPPEGGRKKVAAEARARIEAARAEPLDAPLSEEELTDRRQAWSSLSDLFLDTDPSLSRDRNARLLANTRYDLVALERILVDEVTPVVWTNVCSIAGEWASFDEQWLEERMLEVRARAPSGRRSRLMWPEWLLLRDAIIRERAAPSGWRRRP